MSELSKQRRGYVLIILITLFAFYWFISRSPIPQDISYHAFSDSREIFGITNFCNVISNFFFLVVGIAGLYKTLFFEKFCIINDIKIVYIVLFSFCVLIAFGSAYYHLLPNNSTLLWDRLPMSVVFMTLFIIIISEFISLRVGKLLFIPLICAGITSVMYWYISESLGQGDLRLYALVQFYPLLLIPVILIFFKSRYTQVNFYWVLIIIYGLSKVFEYFDAAIFEYSNFISGHTIKHILAAMAVGLLLIGYQKRQLNTD